MPKKINGTILSGYVIVLERNGLAVKKGGIIKDSEFLPYSSITSVSVDCPLIGTGTITFYLGLLCLSSRKAMGYNLAEAEIECYRARAD